MKKLFGFLSIILVLLIFDVQPIHNVYAEESSDPTETTYIQEEPAAVPDDWYTDYEYTLSGSKNTITLTGYNGTDTEIIVPAKATIEGTVYSVVFAIYGEPSSNIYVHDMSKVTSLGFEPGVSFPKYSGELFAGCAMLQKLDLSNIDTSNILTMSGMFKKCSSLTELNLSGFNTSNNDDMRSMFEGCSALIELDLSSFDTTNVTHMDSMFEGCSNLAELNLSGFNTSNVTNMVTMFKGCSKLTDLNLSSFDTSNVTYMDAMFNGCSGLTELDLSSFDTRNLDVTNMISMFSDCDSLRYINTPKNSPDTLSIDLPVPMTDRSGKIYNSLPVGTDSTESIELAVKWGDGWYEDYNYTLDNSDNTVTLTGYKGTDTEITVPSKAIIKGAEYNVKLGIKGPSPDSEETVKQAWAKVTSLGFEKGVLLPEDCSGLFAECSGLTELDLSSFDTSNVTDMSYMFFGCSGLTQLDLSSFNTSNVTEMFYMFNGCTALTKVNLSSFDTSKATNLSAMFNGCGKLTELDLSNFDTSNVTYMDAMFSGCCGLTKLNLSSFNTSNIRAMWYMFNGCSSLTELDLGSFDLSNVKNAAELERADDGFYELFTDCTALEKICTPKALNTTLSASLPKGLYEIKEGNTLGETAYTDLCKAPANAILVSAKYVSPNPTDDPATLTALSVTQADGVYGTALTAPSYEKPKTVGTETLSYTGTLSKDDSAYGPTADAPELPGKYTVTVTYKTGSLTFSGSADFVIAKADWEDNTVRTKGSAGVDGRFDLSKKIAEGAKLGAVTVTKGADLLENTPHLSGTLLEWHIKDTSTTIDISLTIDATGADNYNDYMITVNILGDSSSSIEGKILLNGKEVSSFKEALSQMTDSGTDYVLKLGVDVREKGLTLPKTAKSITIYGYGHTLELIGTKITANVPLSLERINIKAVKKSGLKTKLSLIAKKDLKIGAGTTFTTTSTSITCKRLLTLSSALDAKTVKANELTLDSGAALKAAGKNSITIKGTLKGNGGSIELGKDFRKPVILKDTVDGTVNITGEKQPDGTQIFKCSATKISADTLKKAFNVSAITPNAVDTYLYYFGSGKAGIFGESISYNGIRYGVWKDAVAAMNADFKNAEKSSFTVEFIGNVNMKGAFKLPVKGYDSITITGNNSTVTFTGNIKLTGNTTIKNITLKKVDKKGNKISGSVNKGKYTYDGPESF